MKQIYVRAGKRIKKLRNEKGYSGEKLAFMAHITPKFLYNIELGKQGFSA